MGSRWGLDRLGDAREADQVTWGEWMMVESTPELEFEMEKARLQISQAPEDAIRAQMFDLYRAWLLQQVLLRQATRHIAELECQAALAAVPDRRPPQVPWLLQVLRRVAGWRSIDHHSA